MRLSMLALTAVGPRVDHEASVLHETGRAVPGLYAAGGMCRRRARLGVRGQRKFSRNCSTYGRVADEMPLGSRVIILNRTLRSADRHRSLMHECRHAFEVRRDCKD